MDRSEEELEDDPHGGKKSSPSRKSTAKKRKDAFPIDDVMHYFLELRDELVVNGELVSRNAAVWDTLRTKVMEKRIKPMQSASLHLMVAQNRYNLLTVLGLKKEILTKDADCSEDESEIPRGTLTNEPLEDDGDDLNVYTKKFTITVSSEEWTRMSPEIASYNTTCPRTGKIVTRTYKCLKRRVWTNVIDDHFREHMRLGCKLTYTGGRVRDTLPFTNFKGKCEHCNSDLFGEMEEEPEQGRRALFHCTYTGAYKMKHPLLKRQMKGSKRDDYIDMLVQQKMSSSCVRSVKAGELMNEGDREPPQVPTARCLRQAKYNYLSALRLDKDPVMAIIIAKHDVLYSAFIKDVTYEKLIVPFWNNAQIHAERNYVRSCSSSSLTIDASGGFVTKLTRTDGKKSGHIFLFEGVIRDPKTKQQVSVVSMLSERHDTETIRHWLTRWLRDGALEPKECVIDMSLALTGGCVQAFAKMLSTQHYLSECSKILDPAGPPFVPPPCFIRYDVAHFMKLASKLRCLNKEGVVKRTRQFYLRCIGQLIQCQDVKVAAQILRDIFTVALNESEGSDTILGEETPANVSKKRLLGLIGNENQDESSYPSTDEDGMDPSAEEELEELFWDNLSDITDNFGKRKKDFSSWGESIFEEVTNTGIVEGDWGNQQFLPDLPKSLLKLVDVMPLWSAIMVPHFGYGGPTASSASSESNFNDAKNRVFKHLTLPVRLDEFLLFYIKVLSGKIKLNNASFLEEEPVASDTPPVKEEFSDFDGKLPPTSDIQDQPTDSSQKNSKNESEKIPGKGDSDPDLFCCSSCNEKSIPENDFSCFFCGVGVHPNPRCAIEVMGAEESDLNLACIACSKLTHKERLAAMEHLAKENWRGLAEKGKRLRKSYLEKNSEWLSIDLSDKGTTVPIAILKNGNDTGLKPIKLQKHAYVLTNTCPFDSVLQLYATAYCDSANFKRHVEGKPDWPMTPIILQMATKGATPAVYRQRAAILKDHFPKTDVLGLLNVQVACHAERILDVVNVGNPSGLQTFQCTSKFCPRQHVSKELPFIDIFIEDNSLANMSQLVLNKLSRESGSLCRERMTQADVEQGHAFLNRTWSKHPMCNGSRTSTLVLQGSMLWLLPQDKNSRKLAECTLRLGDLPKVLKLPGMDLHLRGVVAFKAPSSNRRGAIGHYKAYCNRRGKWEVYDDMVQKVQHCSSSEVVVSHAVFYTQ